MAYFQDEDSYDDLGSEYYDDEGPQYYEEVQGELDVDTGSQDETLNASHFEKVQKKSIQIDFEGNLEQWKSGAKPTTFQLGPHIAKHFKQNVATKNRVNATDDQLEGCTDRVLVVGMKLNTMMNTSGVFMGIDIPHIVPGIVSKHGRHVIRINPRTKTLVVDKDIYDPNNPVTKWMYENGTIATPESVKASIDYKKECALIEVNSLPYVSLTYNIEKGAWKNENLNTHEIFGAEDYGKHWVQVPIKVAKDIEDSLMGPINDLLESCISINDFVATLYRADGYAFNNPANIEGDIQGSDLSVSNVINEAPLVQHHKVAAEIELYYVTMSADKSG